MAVSATRKGTPASKPFCTCLQVVDKVSQKGCTTYQSIADELINELQQYKRLQQDSGCIDSVQPSKRRRTVESTGLAEDDGEKNVRRRVYDSLNVLKAVGAVIPLKGLTGTARKEVLWVGLPSNVAEVQAAAHMQEELKQRVREVQQVQDQIQARFVHKAFHNQTLLSCSCAICQGAHNASTGKDCAIISQYVHSIARMCRH